MAKTASARSGPKGDKRARTRARLLEAARDLIRETGYERTTLRAVAERAGMTSGAIYGNFKDREDLFMALADAYWPPLKPHVPPGATFPDVMHALAAALIAALPDRRLAAAGRLTGMAYALKQDAVRERVRAITEHSYAAGAAWLTTVGDARVLPMPNDTLVRVLHALIEGLTFQRLLTPELFPDDVIYAAFAALAGGPAPAVAPVAGQAPSARTRPSRRARRGPTRRREG
ncbi:MAG: TetR/AcrR family transcriptional regulator [Vicinamibacterales bacterium]